MMELQQAKEHQNKLILLNARDITHPVCGVMESSDDLHEANRQIVLAMQEAYGSVYLGKINPSYGMTYGKLERYDGQPLYSCDFCIPVYNEELEAAIHFPDENYTRKVLENAYANNGKKAMIVSILSVKPVASPF